MKNKYRVVKTTYLHNGKTHYHFQEYRKATWFKKEGWYDMSRNFYYTTTEEMAKKCCDNLNAGRDFYYNEEPVIYP
jgi:hypothetical protein